MTDKEIVPVPQTITGFPVIYAAWVTNSVHDAEYVVIVADPNAGRCPYHVWRVYHDPETERQPDADGWIAGDPAHDLSLTEALGEWCKRARLVPDDYWAWLEQNTERLTVKR